MYFSVFLQWLLSYKRHKNGRPHFEILIKNQIKYFVLWHILQLNKKVDKFQLRLKTAASLFPFGSMTFIIRPTRGRIFSCVWPSYEQAISDLDRSINISLWIWVAHSSFTEGSHMTKNTASGLFRFCEWMNAWNKQS